MPAVNLDPDTAVQPAGNIEDAIQFCFREEMGYVGPHRTIFALSVRLFQYRRLQFKEREEQRDNLMKQLYQRIGIGSADHLDPNFLPESAQPLAGYQLQNQ